MKQTDIVKRAFHITVRHPVLWIFGVLLALTSGGGGAPSFTFRGDGRGMDRIPALPAFPRMDSQAWIAIALLCCLALLIAVAVSIIVQYVSRTALYRMVNEREESGSMPSWREGFRLGWSHRAFRLFLLELIVGVVLAVGAILLLALAATPLLLLLVRSPVARGVGIGLTVVLELTAILVLIAVGIVVGVLGQFWSREIALADRGIGEAFSSAYQLVRSRLRDVGLMWLLLLAIGFGYGLAVLVLALVVILLAALIGGGLGYGIYAATRSIPWGVVAGVPVFALIVFAPLVFVEGLFQTFYSSAWTLAYRQVVRPTPQVAEAA